MLSKQRKIFKYFFYDFEKNVTPSEAFMTAILTNLESQLFLKGSVVCEEGTKMKDLLIVAKGSLNLYGFYDHLGERHQMLITHLPKKSWYGDF